WYRRAAEQGVADAQTNLALMYGKGKGVPQDYVLAYMWINLAAAQNSTFEEIRNIIEKEMTPSQLEKGQRLSRECLRKNYKGC
ncbi:MAG: sel1 repeat family protein, partial [Gammaproteobacteria bacterium]|nr:sel1 repeat family protein [Gammaproteobacteria bacterium]